MFINGINITPKGSGKKNHACAIEGPIAMTNWKKHERAQAEKFINRQLQRFDKIKGVTPLIEHEIKLKDPTLIKQRYRPRNPTMQEMFNQELYKMLAEGVVQPSTSPWSSPVVITRRKDSKPRFCVDFKRLNNVTKKDAYPLTQVNTTLDKLQGARYLSTIDLKNGYWHVPLTEESKALTAFTVSGRGLFEFNVMPFSLHSASSTFQRLLDRVITPDMAPHTFAYLDDIVACTTTFQEHIEVLAKMFQKSYDARLKPNLEKCQFFRA